MRKLFVTMLVAAFVFAASTEKASAQFGIQGGIAMPMGDWGDFWGMGFGGQVFFKKEAGDGMKIGGTAGYFAVPGEEIDILGSPVAFPDITMIPVMATFDYALGENLYTGADAGYTVISISSGGAAAAGSSVALVPKIGVKFGGLHIEGRYNVLGDNYLAAVVGFSFGE